MWAGASWTAARSAGTGRLHSAGAAQGVARALDLPGADVLEDPSRKVRAHLNLGRYLLVSQSKSVGIQPGGGPELRPRGLCQVARAYFVPASGAHQMCCNYTRL